METGGSRKVYAEARKTRGRLPAVRTNIVRGLVENYGVGVAEIVRQVGISTSRVSKILMRTSSSQSTTSLGGLTLDRLPSNSPHPVQIRAASPAPESIAASWKPSSAARRLRLRKSRSR